MAHSLYLDSTVYAVVVVPQLGQTRAIYSTGGPSCLSFFGQCETVCMPYFVLIQHYNLAFFIDARDVPRK
jgi:hypothetical protein